MAEVVETIQAGLIKVDVVLDEPTKKIWDEAKNNKAEMEAVDPGVQAELPKSARRYRRDARWALRGQKGLTHEQKIENLIQARDALDKAIALMQTGEI